MGFLFETVTLDLIFVLSTLLCYLYLKLRKRLNYFSERGIPFVTPKQFFEHDSLGFFRKESSAEDHQEMYNEMQGKKYAGYFSFYCPRIMIRDPDLIVRMIKTDFSHFNDHGIPADPERNILDRHLFALPAHMWKPLRKRLVPAFTSGKMKGMEPLISECVENFMEFLEKRIHQNFELKDTTTKFTLDVIGSCAFGVKSNSLVDDESEFKKIGRKIFSLSFLTQLKLVLLTVSPQLVKLLRIPVEDKEISGFFKGLLKDTMDFRKKTGTKRNDFVDLLMQLKEKGSVDVDVADKEEIEVEKAVMDSNEQYKLEITDELLTAQAYVFFLGGHETTATAITFLLYLFSKNPEVQEKARQEVRAKKAELGKINYDAVRSMEYLNACILESMRIFPPAPILPRRCTKTYHMDDGAVIEEGMDITIPIYALHHDPELFPEPETFLPERFIRGDNIHPGSYLPFGDGPRACIARRFAILEIHLVVSTILDRFEVTPNPKMKDPLKLESEFFVIIAKGGTWVTLKKHSGLA